MLATDHTERKNMHTMHKNTVGTYNMVMHIGIKLKKTAMTEAMHRSHLDVTHKTLIAQIIQSERLTQQTTQEVNSASRQQR